MATRELNLHIKPREKPDLIFIDACREISLQDSNWEVSVHNWLQNKIFTKELKTKTNKHLVPCFCLLMPIGVPARVLGNISKIDVVMWWVHKIDAKTWAYQNKQYIPDIFKASMANDILQCTYFYLCCPDSCCCRCLNVGPSSSFTFIQQDCSMPQHKSWLYVACVHIRLWTSQSTSCMFLFAF